MGRICRVRRAYLIGLMRGLRSLIDNGRGVLYHLLMLFSMLLGVWLHRREGRRRMLDRIIPPAWLLGLQGERIFVRKE